VTDRLLQVVLVVLLPFLWGLTVDQLVRFISRRRRGTPPDLVE
jgi:predicted Na+-dependent transporter